MSGKFRKTETMKKITRALFSIAATVLALGVVSCKKDNTLYYNNMTMGNIVNGRFVTDNGNILNVVEQNCEGKLDTMKRAIVICDVLNETAGAEKEYDVRLNQLAPVLTKNPVAAIDATTGDIAVKDPIYIRDLWYSGGYLNMYIQVPIKQDSKVKHLINIVHAVDEKGVYTFELRHNAFGELRNDTDPKVYLGGCHVSFPILDVIKKDSAKIKINWKWYEAAGYSWSNTIKEYSAEYDWKREGYEQVPQALTLRSSADIR